MTARADRAALEWALALADRVVALTVGPPGRRAFWTGRSAGAPAGGAGLGRRRWASWTSRRWRGSSPRPSAGSLRTSSWPASGGWPAPPAPSPRSWPRTSGGPGRRRHPAWPRGGRARRRAAASGRPARGARRPLPGRRHRDRGLRRAALRVGSARGAPRRAAATRPGPRRTSGSRRSAVRAAVRLRVDRVDWPRPRPRRTAARPGRPARSAAERLRQLVGGGRPGAGPSARRPRRRPAWWRATPSGRRPHHGLPGAERLRVSARKERRHERLRLPARRVQRRRAGSSTARWPRARAPRPRSTARAGSSATPTSRSSPTAPGTRSASWASRWSTASS